MVDKLSNSAIDNLGRRLRGDNITPADIALLDRYCRTYTEPYELVLTTLRTRFALAPTGRPQKSTRSIIEKLSRDKIMLSRMQDIAGCRAIVPDILEQEKLATAIAAVWHPDVRVIDRRMTPSYGYRAVHIIPILAGKRVEIQIRTRLQHLWAQFSEKMADLHDPNIKYGGGPDDVRALLQQASELIAGLESNEKGLQEAIAAGVDPQQEQLQGLRESIASVKLQVEQLLIRAIDTPK